MQPPSPGGSIMQIARLRPLGLVTRSLPSRRSSCRAMRSVRSDGSCARTPPPPGPAGTWRAWRTSVVTSGTRNLGLLIFTQTFVQHSGRSTRSSQATSLPSCPESSRRSPGRRCCTAVAGAACGSRHASARRFGFEASLAPIAICAATSSVPTRRVAFFEEQIQGMLTRRCWWTAFDHVAVWPATSTRKLIMCARWREAATPSATICAWLAVGATASSLATWRCTTPRRGAPPRSCIPD